jgi:SAM-dependent methyltransferase
MQGLRVVADYYELISDPAVRLKREGPLLKELLEKCPGNDVIDLACGTGMHSFFLAKLGANVTAVDSSDEMLAYAEKMRKHPSIVFRKGDISRRRKGKYDFALCLGNSISMLDDTERLRGLFGSVSAFLRPGGIFLSQILNYKAAQNQVDRQRVVKKVFERRPIVIVKNMVPTQEHTLISFSWFRKDAGGWRSAAESSVINHFYRDDIRDAAREAGLKVINYFGSYDKKPFKAAESIDLISVVRKPT